MLLREGGIFAPLIEYPGGPAERYFRVVVNASHTRDQVRTLVRALGQTMDATREMFDIVMPTERVEIKLTSRERERAVFVTSTPKTAR